MGRVGERGDEGVEVRRSASFPQAAIVGHSNQENSPCLNCRAPLDQEVSLV